VTFQVSTLQTVPRGGLLENYIYVLEPPGAHCYKEWLDRNAGEIGRRLGKRAALIVGYDHQLTREFSSFLQKYLRQDFGKIDNMLYSNLTFAVTDKPLPNTGAVVLFPMGQLENNEEANTLVSDFFEKMITAINRGTLDPILSAPK
jgi:hypothetical protein